MRAGEINPNALPSVSMPFSLSALIISEFLPNPAGDDAAGEWIELWNGDSSPINLSGYRLGVGNGKTHALAGRLGAGEYLLLPRSQTKLTLRNNGETVVLQDALGADVARLAYTGQAAEDKSVAFAAGKIFYATPTPGAANVAPPRPPADNLPLGVPLAPVFGLGGAIGLAILAGVLAVVAIFYGLGKSHELQNLFFPRD